MRKLSFVFIILLLSATFMSCATAITVGKTIPKYELSKLYASPEMDFIGYKIDTNILSTSSSSQLSAGVWTPNVDTIMSEFDQAKAIANTKSLRQLGYNLENNRIANNKADSYFGIYSLQEMELYKSDSRYVSFVEVAESKLNYKDNKGSKNILAGVGGGLVGGGAPLIAVGAVYKDDPYVNDLAKSYMTWGGICMGASVPFLIAALLPTKTKVNFTGLYNIYIYDTEIKSLIRKEAVSVNCEETFKGSYTYDENSKEIVRDYVSQNVYNALLKKYDELSTWLEKR